MGELSSKNPHIAPPEPSRLDDPSHWRDRAEEARVKAEQMADPSAIATMTLVAKHYDILAQKAKSRREKTP
jgi:hypothetical protein